MSEKLVIYHGGECRDGFCAAWLMRAAFPGAEFRAARYGEPAPDVRGREVYVCDFSYPRSVMLRLIADCGGRLTVLDHHKTAERELAGLCAECGGNFAPVVTFDQGKSGARLAWEYLFGRGLIAGTRIDRPDYSPARAPWLVDYTEDRDLWRWALPNSREVNAALRSYPLDFDEWHSLHVRGRLPRRLAPLAAEGAAILRAESQIVASHVRNAAEVEIDGHKVLCVNATALISEVAGELAKGRPFGASYFDRADGLRVWSLRSAPDGVDVSEIARRRGGGGHRHAAGFEEPLAKAA